MAREAWIYDKIYEYKDYQAEAEQVRALAENLNPGAKTLLDVACGTGKHLQHFRNWFEVEGLDLEASFLRAARERNPGVRFHHANMSDFSLDKGFDLITCLFSAIGYLGGVIELRQAISTMARHLNPGGVMILEPWIFPEKWEDGHISLVQVDEPGLKLVRMNVGHRQDKFSILHFHYLVATPKGVKHVEELHRLLLFSHQEYLDAFEGAGLEARYHPESATGRGYYIAKKNQL